MATTNVQPSSTKRNNDESQGREITKKQKTAAEVDEDEWSRFQAELEQDESAASTAGHDAISQVPSSLEHEYIASGIVIQAAPSIYTETGAGTAAKTAADESARNRGPGDEDKAGHKRPKKNAGPDRDEVLDQDAYDNIYKDLEVQEEMYERVDRIKALRTQKQQAKQKEGVDGAKETEKQNQAEESSDDESDDSQEIDDDLLWRKRSI